VFLSRFTNCTSNIILLENCKPLLTRWPIGESDGIDHKITVEPPQVVLNNAYGGIDIPAIIVNAKVVIEIFRLHGPVRTQDGMQVMFNVANPLQREQTITKSEDRAKVIAIQELLERDGDFVRSAVQFFVQAALEAEMTEALRLRTASAAKAGLAIAVAFTTAPWNARSPAWPLVSSLSLRAEICAAQLVSQLY
jgi:hypothetical protein